MAGARLPCGEQSGIQSSCARTGRPPGQEELIGTGETADREPMATGVDPADAVQDQRFRAVADSAPALVWMSEPSGGCTYFNRGWLEFRGRTMEQELGDGWAEGVHPDDFERCIRIYRGALQARAPFEMEYRLLRYDGAYRWVLDRASANIGEPRSRTQRYAPS